MPPGGLHIRWPDAPLEQEARLMDYKWYAALAYVRANRSTTTSIESARTTASASSPAARPTTTRARRWPTSAWTTPPAAPWASALHKVNVVWPLEATITRDFAQGLQEILVVEEKRQVIEYQLKEELYNWRPDVRPNVLGKFDEPEGDTSGGEWSMPNPSENWLLRAKADLTPAIIAKAIAKRLKKLGVPERHRRAHGPAARRSIAARERATGGADARHRRAHALVLQRLPAQHQHPRARRQPRGGRHRLPLHGGVDGPQHQHLHPDGRRGRALGRPGAVHEREAHLRQPRRRHLLPQRPAGDPPEHRRRRQHHLQDALQRRRGDDRRPAGRRAPRGPQRAADHEEPGRRGRDQARHRHRRAGEVPGRGAGVRRHRAPPRRARHASSASCARSPAPP